MNKSQLNIFHSLQTILVPSIENVSAGLKAGMKEKEVEMKLTNCLKECGIDKFWYPVMISAGENTSELFSRRIHLPDDTIIRENEIIIIDATPLDVTETVWGNWCQTVAIGNDVFYKRLCKDTLNITANLESYAIKKAKTVGDIFTYFKDIIQDMSLELIGNNIGHSIFAVPSRQTVEQTPIIERLFIDDNHRHNKLKGILSIEPQLKRLNPNDGKYYAAKFQRIVIYE